MKVKILITKRSSHKTQGGFWEFPGGKVENGEDNETALQRELYEELRIRVKNIEFFHSNKQYYNGKIIELLSFNCDKDSEFKLNSEDHDAYKWVNKEEIVNYNLLKTDIEIASQLLNYHR